MKKTYFLSYQSSLGTHEEVSGFVDSCELIITWRKELPSLIFLVSEASAVDICMKIDDHFGEDKGIYLVAHIGDDSEGRLSPRSWSIINHQKLPPKENASP
ncbi:hypothetical protein NHH73_16490 [Oxalobacteraceae bacterium OTU3CINTB1]|nr:hypothetical protein NHH73_16490 [Oxalobacteraceae bacterium OTU3CINTB1]